MEFIIESLPNWACYKREWWVTLILFWGHIIIFLAYMVMPILLQFARWYTKDKTIQNGIRIYQIFILLCGFSHVLYVITAYTHYYVIEAFQVFITGLYSAYSASKTNAILRYLRDFVSAKDFEELKKKYDNKYLDFRNQVEYSFDRLDNFQKRFLQSVHHSPIPTLVINHEFQIEYFSDTYLDYFQLDELEIKWKSIYEVHDNFFCEYPGFFDKLLLVIKKRVVIDESDFLEICGKEIDVKFRIAPVEDREGELIGVIFYFFELV